MDEKELSKSNKNVSWQLNHSIIRDSYVKLIQELKRKPTIKEVSENCNLCVDTINKHIRELKFDPLKHPLRVLTDDVIISIISSAKNGSAGSQKLWMQLCEGWSEKTIIEHEGQIDLTDVRNKLIEKLTDGIKGNNKK